MTCIMGLTGGIGSGKSTVTKILTELGATTIDADAIVHELQAPGQPMLRALAAEFGESILTPDGALDRKGLGAIVFRDEAKRARLGEIVHAPVIGEMMRRAKAAVDRGDALVVLDIPLLFEGRVSGRGSGALMHFDVTVCVWVDEPTQLARTMDRDRCDEGEARRRMAAQLPLDEKRRMADRVIDNSGSLEATRAQVEALVYELSAGKLGHRG